MTEKKHNHFGLTERDMLTIHGIMRESPAIKIVLIFGSRAKGNFKPGSDVDLAIMDAEIKDAELAKLINHFSESSLPYFVDLVCYSSLTDTALKKHIDRVGVLFYTQKDILEIGDNSDTH
ncbi:MAG: nucleotidyltransferase domain-containing protein [Pseudomonadota bacterium]|nr:nucleotidyltransferase domain-containing protein [Pseudomonadota bacterium]